MKLHLTGIAGTGMGSLAGLLRDSGHDVRGSDECLGHIVEVVQTDLSDHYALVVDFTVPAGK